MKIFHETNISLYPSVKLKNDVKECKANVKDVFF